MKHCKDCEPAQESHIVAYTSIVLSWIDEPFFRLMEKIFHSTADTIAEKFSLPFFNLMVFSGLGRFSDKPDEKDSWRTKCFWSEAIRRGIKMKEFHLGPIKDSFVAEYGEGDKKKILLFDGLPRPGFDGSPSLRWMDDKGIMKEKFLAAGLPVARGGVAFTKRKAVQIFNQLQKPVITKPNLGSRSRHTTIHLHTEKDLVLGFKKAKKLSPLVVVEEELKGLLFRGTLIGDKLVGVVERDPPKVVGDGVSALCSLFEAENERPERAGPIFHQIPLDKEAEAELKRQNITMDDVPKAGQVVTFSQKTSRGCGGTTTEVTDIVHPDNVEILERAGKLLGDPLVGLDFIIEDITKSWREQPHSGIIECNSLPFIDLHHYVLFGKPRNAAGALWDLVMPESKMK